MTIVLDIELGRLKRLPVREDVWQLGLATMPMTVAEKGRRPFRPRVVICRSAATGLVGWPGSCTRARDAVGGSRSLARPERFVFETFWRRSTPIPGKDVAPSGGARATVRIRARSTVPGVR